MQHRRGVLRQRMVAALPERQTEQVVGTLEVAMDEGEAVGQQRQPEPISRIGFEKPRRMGLAALLLQAQRAGTVFLDEQRGKIGFPCPEARVGEDLQSLVESGIGKRGARRPPGKQVRDPDATPARGHLAVGAERALRSGKPAEQALDEFAGKAFDQSQRHRRRLCLSVDGARGLQDDCACERIRRRE